MDDSLTADAIDALVALGEGAKTERKQELHYSRSKAEGAEFIKDLLSLVNAHSEGPAYLLVGIEDGTDDLHDVRPLNLREPNLQQFVREHTAPPIRFSYREYVYRGVNVGIIHIPRSRTRFHLASKSIHDDRNRAVLEQGQIYVRDGTSKRVVNAYDFMLLRGEIEERIRVEMQSRLEPDRPELEVSFRDSGTRVRLPASHNWVSFPIPEARLPAGYDDWWVSPTLFVKNVGTSPARDVVLTVTLPDGCTIAKGQFAAFENWPSGFRMALGLIHHDQREIQLSSTKLSVTEKGRIYPIRWDVICDGMKKGASGILEIEIIA